MSKITHFFPLLIIAFFLFACGNSADSSSASSDATSPETPETTAELASDTPAPNGEADAEDMESETFTAVYRCDGFYPGIASEWVAITTDSESATIIKAEYWNTDDETKVALRIIEQTYFDEGMPGYTGTVVFPGQDPIGFGIVEDMFNLTHDGDRFQQFVFEYE